MCEKAIEDGPQTLEYVPDHLKTEKICMEAVHTKPYTLRYVPDYFKTQEMCDEAVRMELYSLEFVPDRLKTHEMCNEAMRRGQHALQFAPDWVVVLQEMWCEDFDDNDYLIRSRNAYQKRKAQKAKIKEQLLPIAWHPSRWWNWCIANDEKKETEKLWG